MWRNGRNFVTLNFQEVAENLFIIPTPSTLPVMRRHLPRKVLQTTLPWVTKINAQIMIRHVRRTLRAFQVEHPILWLSSPYYKDLVDRFEEKLTCYYVYDELADFVHNDRIRSLLRELDDQLSCRADVVFACTRPLWERRKSLNPETHLILNAADFGLFNSALTSDRPLPVDIAHIPRPIIGLAGWLGYHIDVDLLLHVAQARPDYSLVLVGPDALPEGASRRRLDTLSNVYFLGQKERHDLPHYVRAFDVGLLPYRLLEQIRVAYPLKLHEYLALGRAVVSVDLAELRPHRHLVRIADTYDAFLDQIHKAVDDYDPQVVKARVNLARKHTWDKRVEDIYSVLDQLFENDRNGAT
jgi:glycosyltransferase involved in cell wall biosynthesis